MDHTIWKVTLKYGGEKYLLDFLSAQYGYYRSVTTFDEYFVSRVRELVQTAPGYLGGTRASMLKISEEPSVRGQVFRLNKWASTYLKGGVPAWEQVG
jgi:hypothetical protein